MAHYSLDALMLEDKFRKQMYGKLLARQPYRGGGAPHGLVMNEKSQRGNTSTSASVVNRGYSKPHCY